MLVMTGAGPWCPAGQFHLDPTEAVDCAVVTHAGALATASGSRRIITTPTLAAVGGLKGRALQPTDVGVHLQLDGARVRLLPSGAGLGATVAELDDGGETWIYAGRHRRMPDPTTRPFVAQDCDRLVLDTRYGLPVYRWGDPERRLEEVLSWWRANADDGRASVLLCESPGKSQRILARLAGRLDRPVRIHPDLVPAVEVYRREGIALAGTEPVADVHRRHRVAGDLILAPPDVYRTPWMRRLGTVGVARASGEMQIRGNRRRLGVDRGFVISEHPDWTEIIETARESPAHEVLTIGAHAETVARHLVEKGRAARALGARRGGVDLDPVRPTSARDLRSARR